MWLHPLNRKSALNSKKNVTIRRFLDHYKWWFFGVLVVLVIIYLAIYLIFAGNDSTHNIVYPSKSDWLVFLGSYLAFGGSILLGIVAVFQAQYFTEMQNARDEAARRREIQPIFSIVFKHIVPTGQGDEESFSYLAYDIENIGDMPVRNVYVFDAYMAESLRAGKKIYVLATYCDNSDKYLRSKAIKLLETDYPHNSSGIPESININYDDRDGNAMYQSFKLSTDGGGYYYLSSIESAEIFSAGDG